jgi:hypothetical protein
VNILEFQKLASPSPKPNNIPPTLSTVMLHLNNFLNLLLALWFRHVFNWKIFLLFSLQILKFIRFKCRAWFATLSCF